MEIKYKGLWTPKYLAEDLLFPKSASVQNAELKLTAFAHDIIEENANPILEILGVDTLQKAQERIKIMNKTIELAAIIINDCNNYLGANLVSGEIVRFNGQMKYLKNE